MSWLPVANIHGVLAALTSMELRYASQTNGLNLSKPCAGSAPEATNAGGLPPPDGSA